MARLGAAASRAAKMFRPALLAVLALLSQDVAHAVEALQTSAQHAVLIDGETGSVLFEKNARGLMEPFNLAKLMTLEVLFDQIKKGKFSLDQQFVVSVNAWRK